MKTSSLAEFETEAARYVRSLSASPAGATLVTLSGDLGAGKTAFVKAAARELGIEEEVKSPTFIIMQAFTLPRAGSRGFSRLVHIDAYRLKSAHELEVLGWKELLADPKTLIFLEWPEMVAPAVPATAKRITLVHEGEERSISYDNQA